MWSCLADGVTFGLPVTPFCMFPSVPRCGSCIAETKLQAGERNLNCCLLKVSGAVCNMSMLFRLAFLWRAKGAAAEQKIANRYLTSDEVLRVQNTTVFETL